MMHHQVGQALGQSCSDHGSQVTELRFLSLTKQRYRLTGVLIGADGTHMRQVFRACRLPEVGSDVLFQLRYTQLLVVTQGHLPATVEREHPLGACRQETEGQKPKAKSNLSVHISLISKKSVQS